MLSRFAHDTAIGVDRLHSAGRETLPGPGILLSGMKPDRIFAQNPATPDDPYSLFKSAWSWLKDEFDDFGSTRLLYSRGVKAFIGPNSPKYELDGVHYSLVAWNEHFNNPFHYVAALVPSEALFTALEGRYDRITAPGDRPANDPNVALSGYALTFDALARLCESRSLNILNLGWASNIGGLGNAYPAESNPHFAFERTLSKHSRDKAGHVHKSHITGDYESQMSAKANTLLIPLRRLHSEVHRVAAAYLNLHNLARFALALWHKGQTVTEEMGEDANVDFDESPELGGNETRMLVEAFRWHRLHTQGVTDHFQFPILALANTLDSSSMVKTAFQLDTYDLTRQLPDGTKVAFNPATAGSGAFEIGLWSRHVRPLYFSRADIDLRFLDRRSVSYVGNQQ